MGEFPGWLVCRAWMLREPLTTQWALIEPDERDHVLAFWIRASESDAWTFDQLGDLVGTVMNAGEEIPTLDQWAREVASRRRCTPTRRGPKGDRRTDFRTMLDVALRTEFFGMSKRAAYREIGAETNRSPEAVESASKRGNQWPPGAK